ncbi:MAG: hypothetical protein ACKE9I_01575 [Methylophagaceae bacterium]
MKYTLLIILWLCTEAVASEQDNNQRFAVDLSTRVVRNFETNQTATLQFVGFDYLKIFSGTQGDIGTLLLQPYIARIDNLENHPPFFDDEDDTELTFRNFYFNYTGINGGRFNIRLGHFEIPFGLEQVINTNGTLHDFIHGANIGVKADWGASLNGTLPTLEYEFALTRASGNEWETKGNPYFLSGRVGSSREKNFSVGISALDGELFTGNKQTISRSRYGIDFLWYRKALTFMGDLSIGKDESTYVFNSLLELNWHNPYETVLVYLQYKRFAKDFTVGGWDSLNNITLGAQYDPDNHWQFDAQLSSDQSTIASNAKQHKLALQLRYRF